MFEILSAVLYWYLLLRREKYLDLVVISNTGMGRNFCDIFSKSQKLCLHKIFNIGLTTKDNCLEFYTRYKMFITPVLLKIIHFTISWTDQTLPLFASFRKNFFNSENVYVMFMNGTSNVLALTIFLGRDWFRFFLNKWGCIKSNP